MTVCGKAGLSSKASRREPYYEHTRDNTTESHRPDGKATGLTPVYLEGALVRTRAAEGQPGRPGFAAILRGPAERPGAEWRDSILNPFSVYDKNPDLLAQELTALRVPSAENYQGLPPGG